MRKILDNYNSLLLLSEDGRSILDDDSISSTKWSISTIVESLKHMFSKFKTIALSFIRGKGLDQIGLAILGMIRSIPLLGKLIPIQKDKEKEVKEILGTISIGNGVTKCMNILQNLTSVLWNYFPLPTNFKEDKIKAFFNYNDRQSFLQSLYKMMLDADISSKHANAFLITLALKIPIYNLLFVFKSLWADTRRVRKTTDDELHPWTSGDPVTNPETGLNECEQRLMRKVQQFIQIKKMAEMNENDNTLELNSKLNRAIIKEAIVGIIVPFFLPYLNICKITMKVKDDSLAYLLIDTPLRWTIYVFYYYFLATSIILTSLAIDNEETFHPSQDKENEDSTKDNKLSSDGSIDFHRS